MNLRRSTTSAGRVVAACMLTGAVLALGAGTAGAATVPAQSATAAVPAYHHGGGGGGHFRGGGGHFRGGDHYRGGGAYYGGYTDGCNPYFYGYYDLDNPTCN